MPSCVLDRRAAALRHVHEQQAERAVAREVDALDPGARHSRASKYRRCSRERPRGPLQQDVGLRRHDLRLEPSHRVPNSSFGRHHLKREHPNTPEPHPVSVGICRTIRPGLCDAAAGFASRGPAGSGRRRPSAIGPTDGHDFAHAVQDVALFVEHPDRVAYTLSHPGRPRRPGTMRFGRGHPAREDPGRPSDRGWGCGAGRSGNRLFAAGLRMSEAWPRAPGPTQTKKTVEEEGTLTVMAIINVTGAAQFGRRSAARTPATPCSSRPATTARSTSTATAPRPEVRRRRHDHLGRSRQPGGVHRRHLRGRSTTSTSRTSTSPVSGRTSGDTWCAITQSRGITIDNSDLDGRSIGGVNHGLRVSTSSDVRFRTRSSSLLLRRHLRQHRQPARAQQRRAQHGLRRPALRAGHQRADPGQPPARHGRDRERRPPRHDPVLDPRRHRAVGQRDDPRQRPR